MTLKALFVAPYAAMENLIEECMEEECDLDLQIKIGNLQEGVTHAKVAEAQGVDIIISRGGTAKLIGEAVDIPVIDVHLSGYDMLRVLTIANDFPRKKAIVGFSAITLGAKAIIDLLEIPIDIFTIENEGETEPLLSKLKQEGYQLIMGDVVTFETASKLGLMGILIQSGREAIFNAFKEAKMVSRWMEKSKLEINRLKNVLQVTATDMMVLSENGDMIYEQWTHFNGSPLAGFSGEISSDSNEENREITQVVDGNGELIKVVKRKIVIDDSFVFVYEFEPVKVDPVFQEKMNVGATSAPLVIHQSEAMKMCLTMINRCLSYNQFILMGKRGTGKELIAKYIHYQKYNGSGLYAAIKAADVLSLAPEKMDRDIKTIYIQNIEQLDEALRDAFWRQLAALRKLGLTTILPMMTELPSWGNEIYDDDVIRIPVPALAERKEDLRELVTSFILHFNQTLGTSVIKINEKGLALLNEYSWPGNVDELRALIKDAVLMVKDYVIDDQLIESLVNRKKVEPDGFASDLLTGSLESIEKKIIEKVLEEEEFNQTKAAKRLNINRSTLWRKLKN
jgi:transcriptional regulator, propionate catabolism operon regulatory protein